MSTTPDSTWSGQSPESDPCPPDLPPPLPGEVLPAEPPPLPGEVSEMTGAPSLASVELEPPELPGTLVVPPSRFVQAQPPFAARPPLSTVDIHTPPEHRAPVVIAPHTRVAITPIFAALLILPAFVPALGIIPALLSYGLAATSLRALKSRSTVPMKPFCRSLAVFARTSSFILFLGQFALLLMAGWGFYSLIRHQQDLDNEKYDLARQCLNFVESVWNYFTGKR